MTPTRDTPLILIADDTPVNLDVLSGALAADGFDIAIASDGEMALERASTPRSPPSRPYTGAEAVMAIPLLMKCR